jgi:hypothetical protein
VQGGGAAVGPGGTVTQTVVVNNVELDVPADKAGNYSERENGENQGRTACWKE